MRYARFFALMAVFALSALPSYALDLKVLREMYATAERAWDRAGLEACLSALSGPGKETGYEYLVLRGECLYRLALLGWVDGDAARTNAHAERAIAAFDLAARERKEAIEAISGHALVCQLLAGMDWSAGARYGPRITTDLDRLKAMAPAHVSTRYLQALAWLETPAFFGGDPKRAEAELRTLSAENPGDDDTLVNHARAMAQCGQASQAVRQLEAIVARNPANRLAQKYLREISGSGVR
jgi:hypothetical protein